MKRFVILTLLCLAIFITSCSASTASTKSTTVTTTIATTVATTKSVKADGQLGPFLVKYVKHEVIKDYQNKPALAVYYTFTNNSDKGVSYMFAISNEAFQKGVELDTAISTSKIPAYENSSKEIKPGVTIDVCSIYKLSDTTSDVEFEVSELMSFSDDKLLRLLSLTNTATSGTTAKPIATTASATSAATTLAGKTDDKLGNFVVKYIKHEVIKDYENKPAIAIYYSFTNNSDKTASYLTSIMPSAFQKGVELDTAMVTKTITEYQNSMKEIRPGITINVCSIYKLDDTASDVEFELAEFSFINDDKITKVLKIK